MNAYIIISIAFVGMVGVAMSLALHWDRKARERDNRK
jgi:hypothetical protein